MTDSRVHETEIKLNDKARLGRLTLDNPTALNALRLEMVEAIQAAIARWDAREDIVAILIDADSDKAFCAGGDVVNLYRAATGDVAADYPYRFFTHEYRLCHDLRQLSTPCIAWGHGIVMGGGMGVFSGASHRVVTGSSRLAMPEIKIGLFPDCAGTWFFNRMPRYLARFIALTGTTLGAADALFTGLADHAIDHAAKGNVLDALATVDDWSAPAAVVSNVLGQAEASQPAAAAGNAPIIRHLDTIRAATAGSDLETIVHRLSALADNEEAWLAEAGANIATGCPVTAHLIHRQLEDGALLSLAEVARMELAMALQCCARPDLAEGVRALLVDKDRQPRWRYTRVADVPTEYIDAHFEPAWTGPHPFEDLAPAKP